MPSFDLRGIKVAKYNNTAGVVSYENPIGIGDAMSVNLSLRFAEGRLYAESSLAEYIRKATGGTISIGVKYIKDEAQKVLFGMAEKTRTVNEKSIKSLTYGSKAGMTYVGVGFYCPDMIDGVEKFTAVKASRALFGPPDMSYQTAGENIQFNTPTTTGEFLPDHTDDKNLFEVAICDTEDDAKAWIAEVLK